MWHLNKERINFSTKAIWIVSYPKKYKTKAYSIEVAILKHKAIK